MANLPGTFGSYPATRLRRNRRYDWSRRMMAENVLTPADLIWTVFVRPGKGEAEPVASMPGVDRVSVDVLAERAREAFDLGIPALAVPCGFTANGLPAGFQLMGRPFSEAQLFQLGHAYQGETDWHTRVPEMSA